MTNKSKDKGTKAESAVVALGVEMGFPHMERRALQGSVDKGDIAGVPGVMFEVKAEAKPSFGVYRREALHQAVNANYALPVVVWKVPWKNARQWDAQIPILALMGNVDQLPWTEPEKVRWVSMDLQDLFWYLKEMKY